MNRINGNNLENLKALYGAYNTKKAVKEDKKETVKEVKEFETKKVDANVLDVLAAQNKVQLNKVDTSDVATEKRLQEAFANSAFMKNLNNLAEEDDFLAFAKANVVGVNQEKLAKYLEKPLHQETIEGTKKLFA